jgi:hypothetical protein
MCSRPQDEAGRFLPATNIIPTPTSNPIENSRIARPVDDNFDARLSASVTRTLTPMFYQLMNRLDAMETRIAARYNSTSPARDLSSQPRHLESAYIDRRQHVDAKIQRDPIQHVAPTPQPTSTSAEPSPRRTESLETAAEDVCDISFGDPGTVFGETAASKLAAATTPIPGDMPTPKTDEPQSTSAEPTETPRRTDNLETATKDVGNVGISRLTNIDQLVSGDIAPSRLVDTTPIPKGDATILKIDDDIDGIESSNRKKYDGIDDIEPSIARVVTTADMARDALQILARTSGILLKVKHIFPCPVAHYDIDWGGSLSPGVKSMAAESRLWCHLGSFGDKLVSPDRLLNFFFFHFDDLME